MGILKKIIEDAREDKATRAKWKRTDSERTEKVLSWDLFPGSLAEYNAMKGKEYEIIKLKGQDKFMQYEPYCHHESNQNMLDAGCCGLIRYFFLSREDHFGIPIREKSS